MMNSCAQVLRKALQDLSWSADGKVCVPTGFGFRFQGSGFRASGLGFSEVLGLGLFLLGYVVYTRWSRFSCCFLLTQIWTSVRVYKDQTQVSFCCESSAIHCDGCGVRS